MTGPLLGVSEGPAKPRTCGCCSLNQDHPDVVSWKSELSGRGADFPAKVWQGGSLPNCSPGSNGGCSADSPAGKIEKPRQEKINGRQKPAALGCDRDVGCEPGGEKTRPGVLRAPRSTSSAVQKPRGCCKFEAYLRGPLRITLSSLLVMSSGVAGRTERKAVVKKGGSGCTACPGRGFAATAEACKALSVQKTACASAPRRVREEFEVARRGLRLTDASSAAGQVSRHGPPYFAAADFPPVPQRLADGQPEDRVPVPGTDKLHVLNALRRSHDTSRFPQTYPGGRL
ncbi:uncharacterized protein M6G45_004629 isoform 1-T3 [Spheniscus humboldti]